MKTVVENASRQDAVTTRQENLRLRVSAINLSWWWLTQPTFTSTERNEVAFFHQVLYRNNSTGQCQCLDCVERKRYPVTTNAIHLLRWACCLSSLSCAGAGSVAVSLTCDRSWMRVKPYSLLAFSTLTPLTVKSNPQTVTCDHGC